MCVKPLCWILLFCFTSFSTSHYNITIETVGVSPINMWDLMITSDAVAYVLLVLASAALLIYLSVMFFIIISVIASKIYMHKPCGSDELRDVPPGVSVIKPLMGVDPLLEYNLESHFKLTYPKFELLFCFHDDQDAAVSLVEKLQKRYPHVDVKIFIGGKKEIINPMVQNMAPAYDAASYEYVWICSSRIEVSDEIIVDMVAKLHRPDVSLVHQMPFTTDSPGFGSSVEKVYFGGAMSRFYISFSMLGFCCVTGMSYIFKKSLLDQANGLEWYGQYLAEDFFLTKAMRKRGHTIMSAIPAQQNVGQTTISAFNGRMVRWVRLRLNMMPVLTAIIEPLSDCFPLGLWISWALYYLYCINPFYFFTFHVISWIVLDYIRLCGVQNGSPIFSKSKYIIAWIVRELLSTYIFIISLANPQSIQWGKRSFRVKYGGLVEYERTDFEHL